MGELEKNQEALATQNSRKRGSVPTSGLMAAGKQVGLFLVLYCVLVTASAGNVEFKHHNNTEMAEVLQQIHNRCPDITRLYTLSETSVNGVPLYVLEFTDRPGKHELMEPEMKFIATCTEMKFLDVSSYCILQIICANLIKQ